MTRAEQIGRAAIRWRRLDVAALELEEMTATTGAPSLRRRWRIAADQAADAPDEFMALLADAVAEQAVIG